MAKNEESMAAAAKNKEPSMEAASWILPVAGATVVLAGATVAVLATRRYRRRKWFLNHLRDISARLNGLAPIHHHDLEDISNFSLFFNKDPFDYTSRMKMKIIKMDRQMQMKIVVNNWIERIKNPCKVTATNADTLIGDEDSNNALVEFFVSEFKRTDAIDLSKDMLALSRLREGAEKAKIELSLSPSTDIKLPFITADTSGAKHLNITLTRSKFEALVNNWIERTKN